MVPSEKWRGKTWVFLVLHCTAVLIFTSGFLLTRTELSHYSHCSDVSESPCFTPPFAEDLNHTIADLPRCWTKPAVNRLVIIVLDALRHYLSLSLLLLADDIT